jgi:3-methylfumaryl-CoA hydratase
MTGEPEVVDPAPVAALTALLSSGAPPVLPGDPLPPLWHWVALPRWSPSTVLGLDGHPRRDESDVPADLPRRMFAGGAVTFHAAVLVGSRITRDTSVRSSEMKEGRSGRFLLVRTETKAYDEAGDLLLTEQQHIVYRPAATPEPSAVRPAQSAPPRPPLARTSLGWSFHTDPTLLMRFSAATANAHRIHYDWPYATGVEGYPGLLVHGPLSAIVLAETVRLDHPGRNLRSLTHRNLAPLFCGTGAAITTTADPTGQALTLAAGASRITAMTAQLDP